MIERRRTSFQSDHTECVAYVYLAPGAPGPRPGVVMAHGFGGTQEGSLAQTAQDFAAAGFAVLTFDYRNFGESAGKPRQLINIREQWADWQCAIAHARQRPEFDPAKLALWGSSLSGAHVVTVAASDPQIAAVVAQVPFNGFPKRVEGRSSADTWRLLKAMVQDWWRGKTGQEPLYVAAVGHPGELAVMSSPQAAAMVESMQNATWRNSVAPRVLLDMMLWYRPARLAHRLAMPLLVCLAERDKETPVYLGRQIAERAPHSEVRQYPCTHFDIYAGEMRRQVVSDQIAFLRAKLTG